MLKVTKCKVEIFKEQDQNNYRIGNPTEFIILIRETAPKIWEMIRPELKKTGFPTHFISLGSFYTTRKHQKIRVFLMFSRGIERDQWHKKR